MVFLNSRLLVGAQKQHAFLPRLRLLCLVLRKSARSSETAAEHISEDLGVQALHAPTRVRHGGRDVSYSAKSTRQKRVSAVNS